MYKNPAPTDLGTRTETALRPSPKFFGMRVQKYGGLTEVECLHIGRQTLLI